MRLLERSFCLFTALIITITLSATSLTPANAAEISTYPAGEYLGGELIAATSIEEEHYEDTLYGLGKRHDIKFSAYINETCATWSPWVLLRNEVTGEEHWGGSFEFWTEGAIDFATVSFKDMETIGYPGTTVRAYMYDRDGNNCVQVPDFATATPKYTSKPVKLTFESMNLYDAYFTEPAAQYYMGPQVVTDIHSSQNGIRVYEFSDYGLSTQTVWETDYGCHFKSTDSSICMAFQTGPNATAVGFAIVPSWAPKYSGGTQWPPPGAIDSAVALKSEMGGPAPIEVMTKGGPSESAGCFRVCSGDPIDSYNGNFFERHADLEINGRIGMGVNRSYAVENASTSGSFGYGWNFGYDMRVEASPNESKATVIEPSGNESPFSIDTSTDQYVGDTPALKATLTRTSSGWEFSRWREMRTFLFDANGILLKITDNNGNEVNFERDTSGKVIKVKEGTRWIALTWGPNGKIATAVDNADRRFTYAYDTSGRLVSVTDAEGGEHTYIYDAQNRITVMTDASGAVTNNVFDSEGRVRTQTLPTGRQITFAYGNHDAAGRVINTETSGSVVKTFEYVSGRLVKMTDSSDFSKTVANSYDKKGNLAWTAYAADRHYKINYFYDDRGNVVKEEDSIARSTKQSKWNERSQLVEHEDTTGVVIEHEYDTRGNLVKTTSTPRDNSTPRIMLRTYSNQGDITSTTNALGGESIYEYSPDGDFVSVTDPSSAKTTYVHDDLGRTITQISPGGNVFGLPQVEKDKFTTTKTYDKNNGVTTVTSQAGTSVYTYDQMGRNTTITDPIGKVKTVTYDDEGRITSITYPDFSTDSFAYDVSTGKRSSWTDSEGRTTQYSQIGNSKTLTSPDGKSTTISTYYDWDKVATYLTDPSNTTTKISEVDWNAGYKNSGASTEYFDFDPQGKITSDWTANYRGYYTYDGFNNLSKSTSDTPGRNVSYDYDIAGNITKITYPDATSVSRVLDNAGRVTQVKDWSGVEYNIVYAPSGDVSSVTASNGLRYENTFDGNRVVKKEWKDSLDQVLASFDSSYGDRGLISSDTKTINGASDARTFEWNDNGSISEVNAQDIGWDGKFLTSNEEYKTFIYGTISGTLDSVTKNDDSTITFSYDTRGNRLSKTDNSITTNYGWDAFDRLISVGNDTYKYGIDNLRIKVNEDQQVYDQGLKLLSDGTNKFLWGPGGYLLAQAPLGHTTNEASQVVTDSMGSVYSVLQRGPVPNTTDKHKFDTLATYDYSVFGARAIVSGTDVTNFGFVSEQHDDTGLIYLRARYYDPSIGQFISKDPLAEKTLDYYGYAATNPLQMVDPIGMEAKYSQERRADDREMNASLQFVRDAAYVYPDLIGNAEKNGYGKAATLTGKLIETMNPVVGSAASFGDAVDSAKSGDIVGTVQGIVGIIPGVRQIGSIPKAWVGFKRVLDTQGKIKNFDDALGYFMGIQGTQQKLAKYCYG